MPLSRSILAGLALLLLTAVVPGLGLAADPAITAEMEKDQAGAHDFAPAGRYDGAHLLAQTVKAFDELTLPAGPVVTDTTQSSPHFKSLVTARGKVTRTLYIAPAGRSTLEILVNHEDALKAAGYEIAFECAGDACGEGFAKLKYNGDNADSRVVVDKASQTRTYLMRAMLEYVKEVRYALLKKSTAAGDSYVGIYVAEMTGGSMGDSSTALTGSEGILIEAVEPKPMEQKIVTISADEIDSKMASEGRIALYGIFFDFDKAVVKPDSKSQIEEIAKLLKASPDLHVLIVGHTDNKGKLAYNQTLSLSRAKAVVAMLVKSYGIPAAQMTAVGVGPAAPLASNDSDEGQAKNRRVELVKM
jgi:OOP family OmpA-OmpF porin